jgi:predicted regulator of Ras-like GTPase activity (Roadblock/LC7/MglB family)
MQQISFRMHRLVARLGNNLTAAPRVNTGDAAPAAGDVTARDEGTGGTGFVLAELDEAIASVRGARHALLLGADGLPRGASTGIGRDLADTISAAMTGIHAYSRATAPFASGLADDQWRQTVIEFQHGWIFLIAAGDGAFLAAAAEPDCDIEEFTNSLSDVIPTLTARQVSQGERAGDA